MAVKRNSGSSSKTWEGIEGYVPEFIKKGTVQTELNALRPKQQQELMDKEAFSKKFGFIFGDQIDKVYADANNAKFDEIDGLTRHARDTSLTDMASGQDQYLSTLREQRANAPQSGIMKGANMAGEMQNMLGSQASSSEAQQGYATTMAKLANERGTSAEEAMINAMKDKNSVANQMGTMATEKYGMDVQDEASYLSYLGQENANIAAMLQSVGIWNQAEGQNTRRQTSESSSFDNLYDDSADVNARAQRDVANINAKASAAASASNERASAANNAANSAASQSAFNKAYDSYIKKGYSPEDATLHALGLSGGDGPQVKPKVKADISTSIPRLPSALPSILPSITPSMIPSIIPKPPSPDLKKQYQNVNPMLRMFP